MRSDSEHVSSSVFSDILLEASAFDRIIMIIIFTAVNNHYCIKHVETDDGYRTRN